MSKWKKGLYILSWVPMTLIHWALILLGLIVVPLGLLMQHMSLNRSEPDKGHWPTVLWLWGNDEEWVPAWWLYDAREHWYTRYVPRFWWLAIRNPVNNFRFLFEDREANRETDWDLEHLGVPMEAPHMINAGYRSAYEWAWSGPYAGYRRVWLQGEDTYSELWIGWKVGSSVPGLGFTTQLRRKREIGQ